MDAIGSFSERLAKVETQVLSIEKSVEIALASMDKRMLGVNEWRATYGDMTSRLPTRVELEVLISKLEAADAVIMKEIAGLRESRSELAGKASVSSLYFSYFLAILGILFSVWKN